MDDVEQHQSRRTTSDECGPLVPRRALEIAIGARAAYTSYRVLRYGIDLRQALMEAIEIEELCRREL